jgi:ribosome biogenesis GTPase A
MQKAAEIAINDFRTGHWGRITLETPEQFAQWWAAGQVLDAERRAKREKRNAKKTPQRGGADPVDAAEAANEPSDAAGH